MRSRTPISCRPTACRCVTAPVTTRVWTAIRRWDGRSLRLSGREKLSAVTMRRRLRSSPPGRVQRTHSVRNPIRHDPAIAHSRADLRQDSAPVEPTVSTFSDVAQAPAAGESGRGVGV